MCLGNGEEGERELRSRGVEERREDSIRSGCQQHAGGGGPGGGDDHVPHGKPQTLGNIPSCTSSEGNRPHLMETPPSRTFLELGSS